MVEDILFRIYVIGCGMLSVVIVAALLFMT